MMNKGKFWEIIDSCRNYIDFRKDDLDLEIVDIQDSYIDYLKGALSTYSTDDVIIFGEIFSFYNLKLCRDNIWNWLIKQELPASDDCFCYFRNWIVSLGHDVYMDCFSHPDVLEDYIDEIIDSDSIYFDKIYNVSKEIIEERLTFPTGSLKTTIDNVKYFINEELKKYETEDTEFGPIKKGIADWKNEKKNVCQEESKEELKPDSGDKYGNSHFLMSFFKDEDGSILVNCNEDCENCPMEMLGEKCE